MTNQNRFGGIIHTYQKYDPRNFPSPTAAPVDLASSAFEHALMFGDLRRLTDEELARAVKLDPSQIAGLGPSIDALRAILLERKRKILARYETDTVVEKSARDYQQMGFAITPPRKARRRYDQAFLDEQLYDLERLWYALEDQRSDFARSLLQLMNVLGNRYQVEELAARYDFTGSVALTVEEALEVKEELEKIDELLKQLEEARETAQIAVVDLDALREFAEPGDIAQLEGLRQYVEDYAREMAERQGLMNAGGGYELSPQAYRLFQGKLLEKIFSNLQESRTGRHAERVVGEGAVELQQTKSYEFGDSVSQMDIPQSMINALLRSGGAQPVRWRPEDIEIHRTRNSPKCATVVLMDMSGSMRYEGQYINVKRMALALEGLIRHEYPGDVLQFVEMYTFARPRQRGEVIEMLPKVPTIHDPIVRLKADMSRDDISEVQVPPHFTNIQHGLQTARLMLAAQDTPNRQVILITDGLPTAHFEGSWLYLLYPPDPLTEAATLREGKLCQREGITINLFLVPSWSQSQEDIHFAYRLAETTQGRVIFTGGSDLDRFVIWDYVSNKREIIA